MDCKPGEEKEILVLSHLFFGLHQEHYPSKGFFTPTIESLPHSSNKVCSFSNTYETNLVIPYSKTPAPASTLSPDFWVSNLWDFYSELNTSTSMQYLRLGDLNCFHRTLPLSLQVSPLVPKPLGLLAVSGSIYLHDNLSSFIFIHSIIQLTTSNLLNDSTEVSVPITGLVSAS